MVGNEPKAMVAVQIVCDDGIVLEGHFWQGSNTALGRVIINPATGVQARYYHRYARFLASNGFDVLTYDYRGIGLSCPSTLRRCTYRWRDWGERDFAAALQWMEKRSRGDQLMVVGHSVGGFLPGLAANNSLVDRMLTVGAQYAWWGDYLASKRLQLLLKWHVFMPALTAVRGYFPGRRLGWLEDLPSGVANEWTFRGPRFERSHPADERDDVLRRMASFRGDILAITVSDDEFGTEKAVCRTLRYYEGARRLLARVEPKDYERTAIGHFGLFHNQYEPTFWRDTLIWLRDGASPWPDRTETYSIVYSK